MRQHRHTLKTAIELGAVPAAVHALVCIAETLVAQGNTTRAAEILTLARCYPMNRDMRALADCLFDDLDSTVCPRVMLDAKTRAETLTLDDLAREVLAETTD